VKSLGAGLRSMNVHRRGNWILEKRAATAAERMVTFVVQQVAFQDEVKYLVVD